MISLDKRKNERGAALLEFAIGATVFLVAMFAVIEFGRLLWTHNALADAARRGARYAAVSKASDMAAVKNVVVYGDPAGGKKPIVDSLTVGQVHVDYPSFGVGAGTVSVRIEGYEFKFVIPIIGAKISMPNYATTLTGESAGLEPPKL